MTDLDFDELDKAVNNIMEGGKPEPSSVTPSAEPDVTSASSPRVATPPPSLPSRPPASRRTGRFMDVVHPSSNMKPAAAVVPSSSVSASIVLPRTEASATNSSSVSEPAIPSAMDAPVTSPDSDWPDPVELAKPSSDDSSAAPLGVAAVTAATQGTPKDAESTFSPFLTGAKVEKRPLGSPFSSAELNDSTTPEDESAQLPASVKDVDPTLPDELHGDLLAIEARSLDHPDDKPIESAGLEISPKDDTKLESEKKFEGPQALKPEYTGPTSIPQQYKEEPSSSKVENGSIYDTDSYHQPLAHPAKKKSGWLVVIWILLILAIGAGIGAAVYLFWR
jgi:hypothetical protein